MAIAEFARAIHSLLPNRAPDEWESRTIIAAVTAADFLLDCTAVCTTYSIMGHSYLKAEVLAGGATLNAFYRKMAELKALYRIDSVEYGKYGLSKSVLLFSSNEGLIKAGGPHVYDSVLPLPGEELTFNLRNKIMTLIRAVSEHLTDCSEPALMWFGDNLPRDEHGGPHMLALQNFVYRCKRFCTNKETQ